MLSLLVWIVFVCIAASIVWWILSQLPIPAPMRWIVNAMLGLICLVVLFYVFSSLSGSLPGGGLHRLD